MVKELEAKVTIVVSVPTKYISYFLADWDDIEQKLCEQGGVVSSVLELPEGFKTINLMEKN